MEKKYLSYEVYINPVSLVADVHMNVLGYDVFNYTHAKQIFTRINLVEPTEYPLDN